MSDASTDSGPGRPTDYRPEFADIAVQMCARGATMAELADKFGVVRSTIYQWLAAHQEFSDAVRVGKEVADERVGFSVYERAVGYTYDAVKIMQYEGVPVIVPHKEHVPPDVSAAKFWLTNRQPEKWRERVSNEVTGKDGAPLIPDASSRDVARAVLDILREAQVDKKDEPDAP
jgi:hypothetical protein